MIAVKKVIGKSMFAICLFCLSVSTYSMSFSKDMETDKSIAVSEYLKKRITHFKGINHDDEGRKIEEIEQIYSWIGNKLVNISPKDLVQGIHNALAAMPHFEEAQWRERLKFKAEKRDEALLIDSLSWESHELRLLVLQIDYVSHRFLEHGYLTSTPPRIYYRVNDKLITSDLSDWKYSGLGSITYTIHGFVEAEKDVCPDVLISTGPVGSGNYVYFVQMHFNEESQKWREVWQTGYGHVTDVGYLEDEGQLTIAYFPDKFSEKPESKEANYKLKWGGYKK